MLGSRAGGDWKRYVVAEFGFRVPVDLGLVWLLLVGS